MNAVLPSNLKNALNTFISIATSPTTTPMTLASRDQYEGHSVVYAAVTAIALNLSQVPMYLLKDSEDKRVVGRCGFKRSHYKNKTEDIKRWRHGRKIRGTEVIYDDPVVDVMSKPNSGMNSWNEFIFAVSLFLSLRGEAPILVQTEDGSPWFPGMPYKEVIPLHPDSLREVMDSKGQLLAWEYNASTRDSGYDLGGAGTIRFMPQEIINIRYFNPKNPVRGLSPLSSVAAGIYQDLLATQLNTAILLNNGEPAGILTSEEPIEKEEDRDALIKKWMERYGGPANRRKPIVLHKIKYEKTSLTPTEMEAGKMLEWNREAILGVLGVPKSILSVDADLNYSIQLSQDKNFWDKRLLPIARMMERIFNTYLLFDRSDNVFLAFDLSVIEALAVDLTNKVETAIKLIKDGRCSPDVAYDTVGLDMPEQEGGDKILVSPMLVPIDQVLEPVIIDEPAAAPKRLSKAWSAPLPGLFFERRGTSRASWRVQARRRAANTAASYRRLMLLTEKPYRDDWIRFANWLRRQQLEKFDSEAAKEKAIKAISVESVLFDLAGADGELRRRTRKNFQNAAEKIVDFSGKELGGLHVFDIEDQDALDFISERQSKVVGVNRTIRGRLSRTLARGIKDGETVQDLRKRIVRVFNGQITPARSLTIARTETAQTFGGMRDIIFDKEGVAEHDWTNSGDEHVRPDHNTLAGVGPVKRDTNYMTYLARPSETLKFASDPDGPADQVISCRCCNVAVG